MPNDWRMTLGCPIFRKDDRTSCENYIGIAPLDIVYKILATLLRNRINKCQEEIVVEYHQEDFRKGRSPTNQIFKCYTTPTGRI